MFPHSNWILQKVCTVTCQYYKPLSKLLKKDIKFQQSPQCQADFENLKKVLCKEAILQHPNMEKPYTLFTDTSHYTYSGFLTQVVESPDDLKCKAYTSDSFSVMQQRWSTAEKEAIAVYQSVLKFDLYLRGEECTLFCNHKLLQPLSKGIKMPKLNRWSKELADYNIIHIHKRQKLYVGRCYLQLENIKYLQRTIGEPKT